MKRVRRTVTLLSFLLAAALFAAKAWLAVSADRSAVWEVLALLAAGSALGWILVNLLHELGHLCFGKCVGFRLAAFSVLGFRWVRKNGRFRFSYAPSLAAGYTAMHPKNGTAVRKKYVLYTAGGLCFTILFVAVTAVLYAFAEEGVLLLFAGMLPPAAYSLLLNAVPFTAASGRTDGGLLRDVAAKRPSEEGRVRALAIQGMLYEGRSPSEIPEELFETDSLAEGEEALDVLLSLAYLRKLDEGDFAGAAELDAALFARAEDFSDTAYAEFSENCLFDCVKSGDRESADKLFALWQDELAQDDSPRAKRILAYYHRSKGEAYEVLPPETIRQKEEWKGVAKLEEKLFALLQCDD